MDAAWGEGQFPEGCAACGSSLHRAEWMGPADAAAYMRAATQTLANWRSAGKGPDWVKRGKDVRYARCWIDAYWLSPR